MNKLLLLISSVSLILYQSPSYARNVETLDTFNPGNTEDFVFGNSICVDSDDRIYSTMDQGPGVEWVIRTGFKGELWSTAQRIPLSSPGDCESLEDFTFVVGSVASDGIRKGGVSIFENGVHKTNILESNGNAPETFFLQAAVDSEKKNAKIVGFSTNVEGSSECIIYNLDKSGKLTFDSRFALGEKCRLDGAVKTPKGWYVVGSYTTETEREPILKFLKGSQWVDVDIKISTSPLRSARYAQSKLLFLGRKNVESRMETFVSVYDEETSEIIERQIPVNKDYNNIYCHMMEV
jgi:hypothetical protein